MLATMSNYLLYERACLLIPDFNSPARELHEKALAGPVSRYPWWLTPCLAQCTAHSDYLQQEGIHA